MPSRSSIVLSRRTRQLNQRRARLAGLHFTGLGLGILLSLLLALTILFGALYYADLTRDLPNPQLLPALLNPPDGLLLQPTRLYDSTGEYLLFTFNVQRPGANTAASPALGPSTSDLRRYIPLSSAAPQHLPDFLAKAAVVLNDPGFWTHGGYRLSGLTDPDSHPTIAQKLVSDLLLYDEKPSLSRALRERLLAAQVTSEFGRTQVLEWYLNSADYGNYAYGIDAAAQLYFNKSATDLTPAECAVLAAAAQSPSLNPLDARDLALQRGRTTIQLMQTFGLIKPDEASKALAEKLSMPGGQPGKTSEDLVTALVLHQLDGQFTRERIERGGLAIFTTLDYDLQQGVASALASSGAGSDTSASSAALILNPQSGQILAAAGGPAFMSAHDPGTLLTPFIYLTAFTRGLSPASLVWDIPSSLPSSQSPLPLGGEAGVDVPQSAISNQQSAIYHGPVSMRTALANDYAAASQKIAAQMGADAIHRTETSFGLGAPQVTLLDVASAYGIFAAQGVRYGQPGSSGTDPAPSVVLRVEGLDHSIWLDLSNPQAQPVVAPPLAYLVNNILTDESARWPTLGHPNQLELGRPLGVKLGQSASDSWAVGYTPTRLAAVWQELPSASEIPQQAPSAPATDQTQVPTLLASLMQLATQSLPSDGWVAPPGVTTMQVCDPSGLLPTNDCPNIVSDVFLSGNEPAQADTLFRTYTVNRETGFLATVFTPPELVENKVFMVVPTEAADWARTADIPVAPSSYDAIQQPPVDPFVHFSSPAIFSEVSGKVQFRGTATGADFDHYRVLVGQGLNPQSWIAVGPDSSTRVEDGLLATWDTSGLSGLYAVELQVVRTDLQIDTAITQLTVAGK